MTHTQFDIVTLLYAAPVVTVRLRKGVSIDDPLTVVLGFLERWAVQPPSASEATAFGEPDLRPDLFGLTTDVASEHFRPPRVCFENRREDPDRRRLARAVGPEHAVDGPAADRQVDAVHGAHVAEGLDEA